MINRMVHSIPDNFYDVFSAVPTNESGMLTDRRTGWKSFLPICNRRSGLSVHPDINLSVTKGSFGTVGCYGKSK